MPKHKVIEDQYGQDLEVGVVMGSDGINALLQITERVPTPPPAPLKYRSQVRYSKLTSEQARNLATQLNEAADEIERAGAP